MTEQDDTPEKLLERLDSEGVIAARPGQQERLIEIARDVAALFEKEREIGQDWRANCELNARDLSRLQAVAALDPNFGYHEDDLGGIYWCNGCRTNRTYPHADGCPVGRYEAEK